MRVPEGTLAKPACTTCQTATVRLRCVHSIATQSSQEQQLRRLSDPHQIICLVRGQVNAGIANRERWAGDHLGRLLFVWAVTHSRICAQRCRIHHRHRCGHILALTHPWTRACGLGGVCTQMQQSAYIRAYMELHHVCIPCCGYITPRHQDTKTQNHLNAQHICMYIIMRHVAHGGGGLGN